MFTQNILKNDPQVPVVATQDMDLLVTNPPKVSREVDVPELLSKYDLEEQYSPRGDYDRIKRIRYKTGYKKQTDCKKSSGQLNKTDERLFKKLHKALTFLQYQPQAQQSELP